MTADLETSACLVARISEVLPSFGLAFAEDEAQTTWAVTRSMTGPGLEALHAGQRVRLHIQRHDGFSIVGRYDTLS